MESKKEPCCEHDSMMENLGYNGVFPSPIIANERRLNK
jgi:hypothetical protein